MSWKDFFRRITLGKKYTIFSIGGQSLDRVEVLANKRTGGNVSQLINEALQMYEAVDKRVADGEDFFIWDQGELVAIDMFPSDETDLPPPPNRQKPILRLIEGGKKDFDGKTS